MHSGSSLTPNNPAFSISIGIAALIIEGRPLYDDEYATDSNEDFYQPRHSMFSNDNWRPSTSTNDKNFTTTSSSYSSLSSSSSVVTPNQSRRLL